MSKQPATWEEALVNAGFVDPRNGKRPSYNQLARAVGVPQSTISAIVSGKSRRPKPENIQRIADALRIDVRTVAGWVGEQRTERAPYAPPAEADLLTDRQRRAVDEIIRAIVAERASAGHDEQNDALADRSQPDGATTGPLDTHLGRSDADANAHHRQRGTENEDPARADWAHLEPRREDYDRAADDSGPSLLEADDARAAARGEESQDPGSDEPA